MKKSKKKKKKGDVLRKEASEKSKEKVKSVHTHVVVLCITASWCCVTSRLNKETQAQRKNASAQRRNTSATHKRKATAQGLERSLTIGYNYTREADSHIIFFFCIFCSSSSFIPLGVLFNPS